MLLYQSLCLQPAGVQGLLRICPTEPGQLWPRALEVAYLSIVILSSNSQVVCPTVTHNKEAFSKMEHYTKIIFFVQFITTICNYTR